MDGRPAPAPQLAAEVEAFLSQLVRSGSAEGPLTGASGPVVGPSTSASGSPVCLADASQRASVCAGGRPAVTWKAALSFLRLAATEPPATLFWDSHQRVSRCAVGDSPKRQPTHELPHQRAIACAVISSPRGSLAGDGPGRPCQGPLGLG
eukprot:4205961-Alexandrium_andersonii.AAC.1